MQRDSGCRRNSTRACYDPFPICAPPARCLLLSSSRLRSRSPRHLRRRHPPAPGSTDLSRSLQDLAAKVSPSVVQIFVTGYAPPDEEDRAATGEPMLERSSGSGVIVDRRRLHRHQRARRRERDAHRGGAAVRRDRRRAGTIDPEAARPHGRRAGRRDRSRDRHRGPQGRGARAAGAAVRRLRRAAARPDRARVRQPARARIVGDAWASSAPSRGS